MVKYTREEYNEDDIKLAVQEYIQGNSSAQKIANKYKISRGALIYHYTKVDAVKKASIIKETPKVKEVKIIKASKGKSKKEEHLSNWVAEQTKHIEQRNGDDEPKRRDSVGSLGSYELKTKKVKGKDCLDIGPFLTKIDNE